MGGGGEEGRLDSEARPLDQPPKPPSPAAKSGFRRLNYLIDRFRRRREDGSTSRVKRSESQSSLLCPVPTAQAGLILGQLFFLTLRVQARKIEGTGAGEWSRVGLKAERR